MSIPTRPFGRHTDQSVSILALGGYHLGLLKSTRDSARLVHAAIDAGITFMDNAWVLSFGYPFDSCQLPLNVFDATFRSFEQRVLPELLRQGIAPLV